MQKTKVWLIDKKVLVANIAARRTIGIISFLLLIAAGAYIYIPLPNTPVPITLQTFFVLLCAALLNKKDALSTLTMYLILGALGLPFFSSGQGGLLKLFGPTGGFIVGFIFSGLVVSTLLERSRDEIEPKYLYVVGVMSLGMVTILLFGSLWLHLFIKFSLKKAVLLGAVPFIAGDILKVILAAAIYCKLKARINKMFGRS